VAFWYFFNGDASEQNLNYKRGYRWAPVFP